MYEYSCQITRVVDGDTVDVILDLGFSILHKCREKARGKLSSKYLKDAIDNGKKIVLRSKLKDSKGKYGRVLGEIIVDDININVAMIENHLAVAYHGQSKDDVETEHLANKKILLELGAYEEIKNPS